VDKFKLTIINRRNENEAVAELEILASNSYIAGCIGQGILRGMMLSIPYALAETYFDLQVTRVLETE
jgi:hypothetical protein